MPPFDPRLCPDLERALPGDALPAGEDGHRDGGRRLCEVLFGDGHWRWVVLIAWRRDRLNRWVAQIEYTASGSTYTESYLYDRKKVRKG